VIVPPEVLLVGGYAVALLGGAVGLDWLGKHTAARADRFRTAGFRYHPTHDAWVCPRDELLWPSGYDAELHLVRYRAKPSVCNACPVKHDCTTSPHGREVTRSTQPWPQSEAARFHRGIVLVLTFLAALLLLLSVLRHHEPADLLLVALPMIATGWLAHRFTEHFRRAPAGFPMPSPATGLRVTSASRTAWASDRREVR
jgi:hypothetical protein